MENRPFEGLRKALGIKNMSYLKISETIGMSPDAFYKKISGKSQFTLIEIKKLREALNLTNEKTISIFFEEEHKDGKS